MKPHPEIVRFRQSLRQMCIAQFMLIPRTSSNEEDDAPNLLDFVKEATLMQEANDDIEDQENYLFEKMLIYVWP